MGQLLLGRSLEGGDLHALGVDHADGVLEGAALAGGVHPLEHEEHRPLAVVLAGEQSLLQVEELLPDRPEVALARLLVTRVARSGVRLDGAEVDRASPQTQQVGVGVRARHGPIMSDGGSVVGEPPAVGGGPCVGALGAVVSLELVLDHREGETGGVTLAGQHPGQPARRRGPVDAPQ